MTVLANYVLYVMSYEIYQMMTQDNGGSAIHRMSLQFKVHCIWDGKPLLNIQHLTSVSSTTYQRMAVLWYKNLCFGFWYITYQLHYCFGSRGWTTFKFLTPRFKNYIFSVPVLNYFFDLSNREFKASNFYLDQLFNYRGSQTFTRYKK